jgi:hypothetical protein
MAFLSNPQARSPAFRKRARAWDNIGGADSLADTPSPPRPLYTNNVIIPEIGPEGNNGAFYTPLLGQPGFSSSDAITYHFISDSSAVPLPAALPLFATGLAGLGLLGWRRKRKDIAA